jgi:hypothetical protein
MIWFTVRTNEKDRGIGQALREMSKQIQGFHSPETNVVHENRNGIMRCRSQYRCHDLVAILAKRGRARRT